MDAFRNLHQRMREKLKKNPKDFTLVSSLDGSRIPVDSFMLAIQSDFFETMVNAKWTMENETKEMKMPMSGRDDHGSPALGNIMSYTGILKPYFSLPIPTCLSEKTK